MLLLSNFREPCSPLPNSVVKEGWMWAVWLLSGVRRMSRRSPCWSLGSRQRSALLKDASGMLREEVCFAVIHVHQCQFTLWSAMTASTCLNTRSVKNQELLMKNAMSEELTRGVWHGRTTPSSGLFCYRNLLPQSFQQTGTLHAGTFPFRSLQVFLVDVLWGWPWSWLTTFWLRQWMLVPRMCVTIGKRWQNGDEDGHLRVTSWLGSSRWTRLLMQWRHSCRRLEYFWYRACQPDMQLWMCT